MSGAHRQELVKCVERLVEMPNSHSSVGCALIIPEIRTRIDKTWNVRQSHACGNVQTYIFAVSTTDAISVSTL